MCSYELHWLNSLPVCLSASVSPSSLHVQTPTHAHTLTNKLVWHIGVVTSAGCRLAQRNTTEIPSWEEWGTPQWRRAVCAPVHPSLGYYFVLDLTSKPTVYVLSHASRQFGGVLYFLYKTNCCIKHLHVMLRFNWILQYQNSTSVFWLQFTILCTTPTKTLFLAFSHSSDLYICHKCQQQPSRCSC